MSYRHAEFHIIKFTANDHWPNGGWSLYEITGDQIADRIAFDRDGKVTARHSWCGFIGLFETLEDVRAAIASAEGGDNG